jgi:DUF2934 family protein
LAKSRKTDDMTASATDRQPRTPTLIHADIARRAYDLYLARGTEHGHDLSDWLDAEEELRSAVTATATRRRRQSS